MFAERKRRAKKAGRNWAGPFRKIFRRSNVASLPKAVRLGWSGKITKMDIIEDSYYNDEGRKVFIYSDERCVRIGCEFKDT